MEKKTLWKCMRCSNVFHTKTKTTAFDVCSVSKGFKTKDIQTESRALVTNHRSSNIFPSGCDSSSCSTLGLMVKPEALKHFQGLSPEQPLSPDRIRGSRVWLDSLCRPAGLSASSNLNVICMALQRCPFTCYAKNVWICLPGLSCASSNNAAVSNPRTLRELGHGVRGVFA